MPIIPQKTELRCLVRNPAGFVCAYWLPLLILTIGATADVITTLVNLRRYGPEVEAHIVQRWISQIFGVEAGVPLAKLAQLAFVLFVAAWWKPWTPWLLSLCGLLYSAAAVSNHYLLF
jgi:hypothetical protein